MEDETKNVFLPSVDDIDEWFDILNSVVFDKKIKIRFGNIEIRRRHNVWAEYLGQILDDSKNEKQKLLGRGILCNLFMTNKFPTKKFFVQILAHEMVHHYQFTCEIPRFVSRNISHGKSFWKWKYIFKEHGLNLRRIAKAK